jgi:hypothetical protein
MASILSELKNMSLVQPDKIVGSVFREKYTMLAAD